MFNKIKNVFRKSEFGSDLRNNKGLLNVTIQQLFQINGSYESEDLEPSKVKEMLDDIDIAYAIRKMSMGVSSRDWEIVALVEDDEERKREIYQRLSKINIYKFIKQLDRTRYYGYGGFELVWDEEFNLKELIEIPQEYMKCEKGVWSVKIGDKEIKLDDPLKYIVVTYNDSLSEIHGKSVLKPIVGTYDAKNSIRDKMRAIADRYGEVITVFAYDGNAEEEDIKARAEQLKNMRGRNVVAIPVWDKSLKDSVHFINLADLKTEIHTNLEDRWKGEISKFILGADYSGSDAGTGSFARDKLQQVEQEKQEEEILKFIRESFQKLLIADGMIYGYNHEDFYIKFEKEKTEEEESKSDKAKEEVNTQKANTIKILSEAGYELSPQYVSDTLGIPLEVITKKDIKEFARGRRK